jgi:two-component system sensor histidine kinase DesK
MDPDRTRGCEGVHSRVDARPDAQGGSSVKFGVPYERKWRIANALVWLIWSVYLFIEPIQEHTRRDWLIFAAVFAAFLAIYFSLLIFRTPRKQALLLFALCALGAAYYPLNVAAGVMFIYAAAMVPFAYESPALTGTLIAVFALLAAGEGMLLGIGAWNWAMYALIAVAVGAGNVVVSQKIRANQRLTLAQEQIEHLAKLAERERIARDLHDVLGHTLSVVVLKSELAGKVFGADLERARREIGEVEQIARKALAEVREAIRGYRAEGLTAEIERARKALDAAGITLEGSSQAPRLEPSQETVLSLALREAVTNVLRHAGARRCHLELSSDGHRTLMVMQDDGRGAIEREGTGLRGMRERIESVGGRLQIASQQGTRLTIEIPAPGAVSA